MAPEQKGHPKLAEATSFAAENILPSSSNPTSTPKQPPGSTSSSDKSSNEILENLQVNLSPLDQVRQAEAESLRKVIIARQLGERKIYEARAEATRIKKLARESAVQQSRELYKETAVKAEREAQDIKAQAKIQAENLTTQAKTLMEDGVRYAVNIVLGLPGGDT